MTNFKKSKSVPPPPVTPTETRRVSRKSAPKDNIVDAPFRVENSTEVPRTPAAHVHRLSESAAKSHKEFVDVPYVVEYKEEVKKGKQTKHKLVEESAADDSAPTKTVRSSKTKSKDAESVDSDASTNPSDESKPAAPRKARTKKAVAESHEPSETADVASDEPRLKKSTKSKKETATPDESDTAKATKSNTSKSKKTSDSDDSDDKPSGLGSGSPSSPSSSPTTAPKRTRGRKPSASASNDSAAEDDAAFSDPSSETVATRPSSRTQRNQSPSLQFSQRAEWDQGENDFGLSQSSLDAARQKLSLASYPAQHIVLPRVRLRVRDAASPRTHTGLAILPKKNRDKPAEESTEQKKAEELPKQPKQKQPKVTPPSMAQPAFFDPTEFKPRAPSPKELENKPHFGIKEMVYLLHSSQCNNIAVYDLYNSSNLYDYKVIASVISSRQMIYVAELLLKQRRLAGGMKGDSGKVLSIDGRESDEWVAVNLGDITVHLMTESARELYWPDLEAPHADHRVRITPKQLSKVARLFGPAHSFHSRAVSEEAEAILPIRDYRLRPMEGTVSAPPTQILSYELQDGKIVQKTMSSPVHAKG